MRLLAVILVLVLVWAAPFGSLRADFAVGFDDFAQQRAELESKLAQDTNNVVVLLELGKLLHNEAALEKSHPKELVREAEKLLRRVVALSPTNMYAQAMLGSTVVMSAREAFLPTTKIKIARKGLEQIDAAVKAAPEDCCVRFTRASNNTFLPEFFHRRELVVADFEWLIVRISAHPEEYDVELRQFVYLYYGVASQKFGDKEKARKYLEAGILLSPKSKVADRLRSQLETLADKKKK